MKNLRRKIHNITGWIASLCFMLSGAPAAYEALVNGYSTINKNTLILWTVGELCAIVYIIPKKDKPLLANYIFNIIMLLIIWYYR